MHAQPDAPSPVAQTTIEIDAARRLVWHDRRPVALGGRAFDLLACLAGRPGHTFGPDELIAAAWPGRVIEASNLRAQVNRLRQALGADVVANVPGRGYRLQAMVQLRSSSGGGAGTPGLFGRELDLQALDQLAAAHRLVTVVGAGGIGKTSLVRAWHEQRPAERDTLRAWVDLAVLRDAGLLLPVLASALELPVPEGVLAWTVDALVRALPTRRSIQLVLDNAEPLVPTLRQLLPALLDGAGRLRLLLTSQVPLHLPPERLLRLGALECPPAGAQLPQARRLGAVALFVARAQAAQPAFQLTEANLPQVIALCQRLDGMPLALELAAARLPALGLHTLSQALDERLHLLAHHQPTVPPRQRTLQAALAWTLALLDAPARTVFARVAVFAGPFSVEAAVQVAGGGAGSPGGPPDGGQVLDVQAVQAALQTLVDASLLLQVDGPPPRLRLLETPRVFAQQELQARGEVQALRLRHLAWCASWLDSADPAALQGGLDELNAALEWSQELVEDVSRQGPAASPEVQAGLQLARRFGAQPAVQALRGALAGRHDPAQADDARRAAAQAGELLRKLRSPALQSQAAAAGLGPQALAALAARFPVEDLQQLDTARAELGRALDLAGRLLQDQRAAADEADDDDTGHAELAAAAVGAAADATRAGLLDQAAEQLDDALAELERREARRAAAVRRDRHRLLDASLQQQLLLRDAEAAADRIEAIVRLDEPLQPTASATWLAHEQHYLDEGGRLAAPLLLDVCCVLARRRSAAATTPAAKASAESMLAQALGRRGLYQLSPTHFQASIAAAQRALAAQPREADPQTWATAHLALGSALGWLGQRQSDSTQLQAAVDAAHVALEIHRAGSQPDAWAAAQHVLGSALTWLGVRDTSPARLDQAIAALQAALTVRSLARDAYAWASSSNQLGVALSMRARYDSDTSLRKRAIAHHEATVAMLPREQLPAHWGSVVNTLGIDLMMLAMHEEPLKHLQRAVELLRPLQTFLDRDAYPSLWTNAQHNLGITLSHIGQHRGDADALLEAAQVFRTTLQEFTLARSPLAHAAGHNELASALMRWAALMPPDDPQGLAALHEAVASMAIVEQVRDRGRMPLDWARSRSDSCRVQLALACRLRDAAAARAAGLAAVQAGEDALGILCADADPEELAAATASLADARAWLAAQGG